MSKMIQIRHVPDDVHKQLKLKALEQGTSLSEYLVQELTRIAKTPSVDDVLQRIHQRNPVKLKEDSLQAVQAERVSR